MKEVLFGGSAWCLLLPACGEKVGMRGRHRRRCGENRLPNAFDISQHLVIPEPQDTEPMFDEPLIADGVASVLGVLAAIDFDDKPFLSADKVDHVRPDRLLTHEFKSAERPRTKAPPKLSFGECGVFAQLSGQTRFRYVGTTHATRPPSSQPSPRTRGEGAASG